MSRNVVISLDQLFRAQPGGIGTYTRGLIKGLRDLEQSELNITGIGPRGDAEALQRDLGIAVVSAQLPLSLLSKLWATWPLGVPRNADVVHATAMSGPFGGGASGSVHSAMIHDVLWRDVPELTTKAGRDFHEARLQLLKRRDDVRVFVTSQMLRARLIDDGFAPDRLHVARLGVDDDSVVPATASEVQDFLSELGVAGPFTLHVGTIEPRKNIERLIEAHALARREAPELGPLVLVGPRGWGNVSTGDAVVAGEVSRTILKGLYRDARLVACVPVAEGWGLPAVEALHAGTRLVVSTATPSVEGSSYVNFVDALDVSSIAQGLVAGSNEDDSEDSRRQRTESVADLTWHECAIAHVKGWQ